MARCSLALSWLLLVACDGSVGARAQPHDGGGTADAAAPDARAADLQDAGGGYDAATGHDAGEALDAAAGEDAGPPGWFTMDDSLRGGTSGGAIGGSFGPDGWTVTDRTDRIYWALPRLVEGAIEFTVTNLTTEMLVVSDNELFALYEAGYGITEPIRYNPEIRENHYKCILRVYGQAETDRVGQQKLMWGMCPSGDPGYGACGCGSFFEEPFGGDGHWDGTPQRIRVEWGGGHTRLSRNGAEAVAIDWSDSGLTFGPESLHVSLGTPRSVDVGDAGMPIGIVFSDLHVEGFEGDAATCP